ncbi:peptide deformylase [Sinobacterium caligoides]|uniref:Peptide deformylase n=1 Tax=Sinobacterium caligoides TaxID=933926 RepID=A0A3N2DN64_9GAMM|nr:peptide deformylase [Sinobacterium caligoides]ROS01122.1 peptide deformylase [Sinobacterium caligoides]
MEETLPVSQLGATVIREVAAPVSDIPSSAMKHLVAAMIATCEQAGGVGIAAPQVGESKRLFIMASEPNARYPDAPKMAPTPVFNPRILSMSESEESAWEGCLSLPGVRGWVPRATSIEVSYYDAEGVFVERLFEGFLARLFQHEYDHLNGVVFIDRVRSTRDIIMEAEYQRLLQVE